MEQTDRVSIEYPIIIERSGMEWNECADPMMELLLDYLHIVTFAGVRCTATGAGMTRSARMEETSMNEMKSINQYSKLISIEHTGMHQVDTQFEDLEYLNTINIQYSKKLSNVTERGYSKLPPSELMDVRFGRSTFYHFESFHSYFALSMNMMNHFFHKVHNSRV